MSRGRSGPGWDIDIVRVCIAVDERILRELNVMRQETNDVAMLLSIAAVVDDKEQSLAHWRKRLDAIETRARLSAHRAAKAAAAVAS